MSSKTKKNNKMSSKTKKIFPRKEKNMLSVLGPHRGQMQNRLNIKESRQMDIIFEISASNYTGWQKFHPKRTEPAKIFNHFLSRSSGPIGVKTELGPPRGCSLRSPRALRARREKKTQHGQCERCAR